MDNFESKFKRSFQESPELSENDETLWGNVLDAYNSHKSNRHKQKLYRYTAVAASLFMVAVVLFFTLEFKKPSTNKYPISGISEQTSVNNEIEQTVGSKEELVGVNNISNSKEKESLNIERSAGTEKKETPLIADQGIVSTYLPDESKVILNRNAEVFLKAEFNREKRNLRLNGEAYFDVKKNQKKPFTIFFKEHKLIVTGTKFNVRSIKGENVEVTVTEGQVHVYPDKDSENYYAVNAGEQLVINNARSITITPVKASHYLVWSNDDLNFDRITLKELSVILSRYYSKEVAVKQDIASCLFSGDLSGLKLEEALKIVSLTNKLEISDIKGQFYLNGPSCK